MNKSLIFLLDVSGSMTSDGKDTALLETMRRLENDVFPDIVLPEDLTLTVRIIAFGGNSSTWVLGDEETGIPYTDFRWSDAERNMPGFGGETPLGSAIAKVVDTLYYRGDLADPEQLAPAIILISDGRPTDNYLTEVQRAINMRTGAERQGLFSRSLRTTIGIGIGDDDVGRQMLKGFGRLSNSLRAQGLETYYELGIHELNQLGEIIKAVTQGFSVALPDNENAP